MGDAKNPRYIFVNDNSKPNSLNFVHSVDNLDSIPQFAQKKEIVGINLKSIGQVCSTTGEQVHQVLYRMRDLAMQLSQQKKKTIQLNLAIGTFVFNPNKTVEFKSINSGSENKTIKVDE